MARLKSNFGAGGAHARYLYTPELLTIVANPPPNLDITRLSDSLLQIGVTGVSGQTVPLQSSSDLQNWRSVATNTLTTSRLIYTNGLANSGQQFFRAIVVP